MSELPTSRVSIVDEDAATGGFLDTPADGMKVEVESVFQEALVG